MLTYAEVEQYLFILGLRIEESFKWAKWARRVGCPERAAFFEGEASAFTSVRDDMLRKINRYDG